MKIIAEFRDAPSSPWVEQESATNCRKVGQEWQCERSFYFVGTGSAEKMEDAARNTLMIMAYKGEQVVQMVILENNFTSAKVRFVTNYGEAELTCQKQWAKWYCDRTNYAPATVAPPTAIPRKTATPRP